MNYISFYRPASFHLEKMWHLIPTILYLTYGEAQSPHPANYPVVLNNEPAKHYHTIIPRVINPTFDYFHKDPARQHPRDVQWVCAKKHSSPYNSPYNYPSPYNGLPDNKIPDQYYGTYTGSEPNPYGSSDSDTNTDPKSLVDGQSYFEDLKLVENFGSYLIRRTTLDGSSSAINDAAHQYNALLSVLIGLSNVISKSCNDFDKTYDQVYLSIVDQYYKYGLANAEKMYILIDGFIKNGNSHIPKLNKLKQVTCANNPSCSESFDNKIKSSQLSYVKELETLQALVLLARSFYPLNKEWNQAAQKGTVLPYLQNSKEKLKEYVMHIVNTAEHITDTTLTCP